MKNQRRAATKLVLVASVASFGCATLLGFEEGTLRDDGAGGSAGSSTPSGGSSGSPGQGGTQGGAGGATGGGNGGSTSPGGLGGTVGGALVGGNGGSGGGPMCIRQSVTITPEYPVFVFALDFSGSMSAPFGPSTKQETAVNSVLNASASYQHAAQIGVVAYTEESCGVPSGVSPDLGTAAPIANFLTGSQLGSTAPTHDGVNGAAAWVLQAPAEAPRYIVLILDGIDEGCGTGNGGLDATMAAVENAYDVSQITTIPMGFDGIMPTDLQSIAASGGSPLYLSLDPGDTLSAIVSQVVSDRIGCRFQLANPINPNSLQLSIDGDPLVADTSNGFATISSTEVQFNGTLCQTWKTQGESVGALSALGCPQ